MEEQQSADSTAAELVSLRESFKLNLDKVRDAFDVIAIADEQAQANAKEIERLAPSVAKACTSHRESAKSVRLLHGIS